MFLFLQALKITGQHIKGQRKGSKRVYQETESKKVEEQMMYKENNNKALYNTDTVGAVEGE